MSATPGTLTATDSDADVHQPAVGIGAKFAKAFFRPDAQRNSVAIEALEKIAQAELRREHIGVVREGNSLRTDPSAIESFIRGVRESNPSLIITSFAADTTRIRYTDEEREALRDAAKSDFPYEKYLGLTREQGDALRDMIIVARDANKLGIVRPFAKLSVKMRMLELTSKYNALVDTFQVEEIARFKKALATGFPLAQHLGVSEAHAAELSAKIAKLGPRDAPALVQLLDLTSVQQQSDLLYAVENHVNLPSRIRTLQRAIKAGFPFEQHATKKVTGPDADRIFTSYSSKKKTKKLADLERDFGVSTVEDRDALLDAAHEYNEIRRNLHDGNLGLIKRAVKNGFTIGRVVPLTRTMAQYVHAKIDEVETGDDLAEMLGLTSVDTQQKLVKAALAFERDIEGGTLTKQEALRLQRCISNKQLRTLARAIKHGYAFDPNGLLDAKTATALRRTYASDDLKRQPADLIRDFKITAPEQRDALLQGANAFCQFRTALHAVPKLRGKSLKQSRFRQLQEAVHADFDIAEFLPVERERTTNLRSAVLKAKTPEELINTLRIVDVGKQITMLRAAAAYSPMDRLFAAPQLTEAPAPPKGLAL